LAQKKLSDETNKQKDGQEHIESLKVMLRDQIKLKRLSMVVFPLYAALSPKDQMKVFVPNPNPK
jgi:HrpA-like RNA helicase